MASMDGMTLSNAPNDPPDGQNGTTNTTMAPEDLEDGEIDDDNVTTTQASGSQSQMDIDDASNASTPREASSVASSRPSSRAASPVRKKAKTHSKQSSGQKPCSTKSDASAPHSPIPIDADTSKAVNAPSLISRIESLKSSTSPLHPQLRTPDESPPPNDAPISHLTSNAEPESEPETDPATRMSQLLSLSKQVLISGDVVLLTPEELDRAKSLVLDLLGWGVEPEYLVYCGVSQPAIYKIFTDLRLRLPTNLDYPP